MKENISRLLPIVALALVALALYLAYKSVAVASPYITQQPELLLNETSWVRIPPGVTDTVQRQNGEIASSWPVYGGTGIPGVNWRE
jgi:hypothetical protein